MKRLLILFAIISIGFSTMCQEYVDTSSVKSCVIVQQRTDITPYILTPKQESYIGFGNVTFFGLQAFSSIRYIAERQYVNPTWDNKAYIGCWAVSSVAYITYLVIITKSKK